VSIFQEVVEDTLLWEDDRDGLYSVKAGYKLIMLEFRPVFQPDVTYCELVVLLRKRDMIFGALVRDAFQCVSGYYNGE
jgi:hypothetical protein